MTGQLRYRSCDADLVTRLRRRIDELLDQRETALVERDQARARRDRWRKTAYEQRGRAEFWKRRALTTEPEVRLWKRRALRTRR
jgi:hypothetical protein